MLNPTQYRSFRGWPFQAECTQIHNNGRVSLTLTETQNTKCRKKKKQNGNSAGVVVQQPNSPGDGPKNQQTELDMQFKTKRQMIAKINMELAGDSSPNE